MDKGNYVKATIDRITVADLLITTVALIFSIAFNCKLFNLVLGLVAQRSIVRIISTGIINYFYLHLPEEQWPFQPLHKRPLMHYGIAALLVGAQMMSIGLLAELMTALGGREEDTYSVSEQTAPVLPRPASAPHIPLPSLPQAPHDAIT